MADAHEPAQAPAPRRYAVSSVFYTVQGEGANAGRAAVFVRLAGCNLWTGDPSRRVEHGNKAACAMWCDTDFRPRERLTAAEVAQRAFDALFNKYEPSPGTGTPAPLLVITGGEPLLQLDRELLRALWLAGFSEVWVETNGTHPPLRADDGAPLTYLAKTMDGERGVLGYTLSPKRGERAELHRDWFAARVRCELKIVFPGASALVAGWTEAQADELLAALGLPHGYLQPQDPIDVQTVGVSLLARNASPGVMALTRAQPKWDASVRAVLALVQRNPRWRVSVQTHKVLDVP